MKPSTAGNPIHFFSRITKVVLLTWLLISSLAAQASFYDTLSEIPSAWDGPNWLIMPLTEGDSGEYYQAYQSSAKYLYTALGWGWPTRKISPEVNADMVRHHVSQHEANYSFTYVVRKRGERAIAGAIYVNPVNTERRHIPNFVASDYTAEVTFWFTEAAENSEQVETLLTEIFTWIEEEWPFSSVLVPVNKNYEFIHQQMRQLEYAAFSEDSESGEQLYRLR